MKWASTFIFANLAVLVAPTNSDAKISCQEWFKKSGIKKGPDCLLHCATLKADMATFTCPNRCDELCEERPSTKFTFKLADLYPGLTAAEKALAAKFPKQLLLAYQHTWKAEEVCLNEFPKSDTNDASDACRHFVWATLITKEFGNEMAQKILDAHEQEPTQPPEQKAMDLANNQRGVTFAGSIKGELSDERILEEFRKLIKEGNLVTLKKEIKK